MFCPQCRQEYRESVTTCEECGVALVGALPTVGHDEPEGLDLVTVLQASDLATLEVAKSLLEAEGIPCVLQGEGLQDLWGTGFNAELVQVQVRPRDAAVALELLETHDPGLGGPGEPAEDDEQV